MSIPYNAPAFNYLVNPSVVTSGLYDGISKTWACTLPTAIYDRILQGISIQGPLNSKASVYLGNVTPANLIDSTQRGNSNTADYSGGPFIVQRSNFVTIQWTPLDVATIFTGTEVVSATFRVAQQN